MSLVVLGLVLVAAVLLASAAYSLLFSNKENALEKLGVSNTYPRSPLPAAKIEAYVELKEKLRGQHAKENDNDQQWMSSLPPQAKDMLKYGLMQRAIGDMATLQKIDVDARGYWRLFSKGMITRPFWNSVMEAERELSRELESVKFEASCVEPRQDPQGIITEAMQFIMRYGADMAAADALSDLMKHVPLPGSAGTQGQPGMMPPGAGPPGVGQPPRPPHPGMLPPGARPPLGHPAAGPPGVGPPPANRRDALPQAGGETDAYAWKQDMDEVEVSVSVPADATKAQVKVKITAKTIRVEHASAVVVEGTLAAPCDAEGSTWTISKGRVVISLEKVNPGPWPSLLKT